MKYIIFDLDGTLVDSLPDITLATNHALNYFGMPLASQEKVENTIGYGLAHTVHSLVPQDFPQELLSHAVQLAFNFYNEYPVRESTVFDGILDMLAVLQEREAHLAILSNKNQSLVDGVVKHFFSHIAWKCVIGIDNVTYKKPNAHYRNTLLHVLETGMDEEQIESAILSQAYMVGDNRADILFAKNANLAFIAASWGYYSIDSTQNLDSKSLRDFFVAKQASDLLSYIYS